MSTGSTRSPASSPGGNVVSVMCFQPYRLCTSSLNIKETNVFGVARDETAARLDVLAHQNREQLVGCRCVVAGDLAEHPHRRVHRGLPQLLGVHLAEALVPLDAVVGVDPLARLLARLEQPVTLAVG